MPNHVLETETKFTVSRKARVPDLAAVPGVGGITGPIASTLVASYFDTPDLTLARAGISLRRRTGGSDAGWHLKLPDGQARHEIRLPLSRGASKPPIALRRIVAGLVDEALLTKVLTLTTERLETVVLDGKGEVLALVCDDSVHATRLGADGVEAEADSWREWELEAHGTKPKLLKAIARTLRQAGAKRSRFGSKPQRALGISLPPSQGPASVTKRASARELLQPQVSRAVGDLKALDPLVRANAPDAVHRMRVASRRLRGVITAFNGLFDEPAAVAVAAELKWLGKSLGHARDLEVLQEHLHARMAALPPGVATAALARWVDARLRQAHRAAFQGVLVDLGGDRYRTLVGTLDSWADAAPWSTEAEKAATKHLPSAALKTWSDLERSVKVTSKRAGAEGHEERLHEVRKAAKRARYAAAAIEPLGDGRTARRGRAAKQIHHTLGDHRDAVVAGGKLRELAATARAEGKDTFALGMLYAGSQVEVVERERDFREIWLNARRLK